MNFTHTHIYVYTQVYVHAQACANVREKMTLFYKYFGYLRIIILRNFDNSEVKHVQIKQHSSLKHSNANIVSCSFASSIFFKSDTI